MEALLQVLIVLLMARLFGEGAVRLGQAASVGELLSGVVLAAALGALSGAVPGLGALAGSGVLALIADAGVFFLVLLAGIEMKPAEMARSTGAALAVASGGVVLPLAGGLGLGFLLLPDSPFKPALALVIGVSMAITAIPATARIFSEFGLLHTRLGELVVSAAVFDDVIGLFLLAVLTAVVQTGHVPDAGVLALMLAKIAAFFAVTIALGVHVYPRISRGIKALRAAELELSVMVAVGLGYGWLAEAIGMHWIMGAFMAGLYFEASRVGERAYEDLRLIVTALAGGLLGPMFFAWIGLQVDIAALVAVPGVLALLIAVAFLSKVAGAGLSARWAGLERRDALAAGVGMAARGEMELVILSIVLESGLFEMADHVHPIVAHLFSALVLMAMVNTLLAPLALRWILRGRASPAGPG